MKESVENISWHCPDCSYKLGNLKKYGPGSYYSCMCPEGYWVMDKNSVWKWKLGTRPHLNKPCEKCGLPTKMCACEQIRKEMKRQAR